MKLKESSMTVIQAYLTLSKWKKVLKCCFFQIFAVENFKSVTAAVRHARTKSFWRNWHRFVNLLVHFDLHQHFHPSTLFRSQRVWPSLLCRAPIFSTTLGVLDWIAFLLLQKPHSPSEIIEREFESLLTFRNKTALLPRNIFLRHFFTWLKIFITSSIVFLTSSCYLTPNS